MALSYDELLKLAQEACAEEIDSYADAVECVGLDAFMGMEKN